jgi:hypothetical protein
MLEQDPKRPKRADFSAHSKFRIVSETLTILLFEEIYRFG